MEVGGFLIGFEGLELGKHNYKFLIDDSFFKDLEYSEIQEGRIVVDAVLTKSSILMEMVLDFNGEVIVPCDLCGENLVHKIDFEESLVIKTGANQYQDDGLIILENGETEINISHYLYESISLSLPSKRAHKHIDGEPRCDEELLTIINSQKDADNNDEIDPRWAELKKLK